MARAGYEPLERLLWRQVLEKLRPKVTSLNYDTWLSHTVGHELSADEFVVLAPDEAVAEWMSQRLQGVAAAHLSELLDRIVHVTFRAHPAPPPNREKPPPPRRDAAARLPRYHERVLARWMRQALGYYGAASAVREHGAQRIMDELRSGELLEDDTLDNPGAVLRARLARNPR